MARSRKAGANGADGPGKPTGLFATLDRLAETMAEGRAWMDSEECAAFLSMNRDEFGKVAKTIPHHPLPPKRPGTTSRRYRYYAPEVTEWLLGR
jgi:hypothetical protein